MKVSITVLAVVILIFISSFIYFFNPPVKKTIISPNSDSHLSATPTMGFLQQSPTSSLDLSYMMVVTDKDADIKLLDSLGNTVGEVFLQKPLADPQTGKLSGPEIKELLFNKPGDGQYDLITDGNKEYKVEVYLYDKNGAFNIRKFSVKGSNVFKINFDKQNSQNSQISLR